MRQIPLRDYSGFTLVELMVVVALVGVLTAIVLPNYYHFMAKSRQSEAKIGLSAAYTAERAFAVENGSFTYCLRQAGYIPDGTNRYYMIGATSDSHTTNLCGPSGTSDCRKYHYSNSADCSSPNPDCCNYTALSSSWPNALTASDIMYDSSVTADHSQTTSGTMLLGPSYGGAGIDTNVTQNTLVLSAVGCIYPVNVSQGGTSPIPSALREGADSPAAFDAWTINENRTLNNPYPGF
jgi:prepilin-type N-terminal cleavage/methylation domain-containing protein